MAFNPFIGLDEPRLVKELRQAQSDLLAGKATVQAGSGEILIKSSPDVSLQQRIRQILRALNKLNPDAYPVDQISPLSQTKISLN